MENKDVIVTLTLNLDEINGVLMTLGQAPYAQVADLINNIRDQAGTQLAQLQTQLAAQTEVKEGELVD